MADLKHSKVLFTAEDGSSLKFYMVPCEERKTLKPLIEHGGGCISNQQPTDSIRLLADGTVAQSDGMVKSSYILDCVKANKLLKLSPYKMKKGECVLTDIDVDSETKYIIKAQAKDRRGRAQYFRDEQLAILMYLLEETMYKETKGNTVWRDMARKQVTKHTWQSMKDHYHKIMLPKIRTFDLSPADIGKLTGDWTDVNANTESGGVDSPKPSTSRHQMTPSPQSKSSAQEGESSAVSSVISPIRPSQISRQGFSVGRTDQNNEEDISDMDEFDAELLQKANSKTATPRKSPRIQKTDSPKSKKDEHANKKSVESSQNTPRKRVKRNLEETSLDVDQKRNTRQKNATSQQQEQNNNSSLNNSQGGNCEGEVKGKKCVPENSQRTRSVKMDGSGDSVVGENKAQRYSPRSVQSAKRRVLSDDSDSVDASPRQLRDFVMLDSQEKRAEKVDSESEEDDVVDLDKTVSLCTRVCQWLKVEHEELLDAVFQTNGSLKQAVKYILHGKTDEGYNVWNQDDDEILQNGTEDEMQELDIKFGSEALISRQQFLAEFGASEELSQENS